MKHHVPLDRRGFLSLAIFLELFNREVIGSSLKPHTTADIVADALAMTWFRRRPAPELMLHSDRGSPIRKPRLARQTHGIWHDLLDESEERLVGQGPHRELV